MLHVARLTDRSGAYYLADLAGEPHHDLCRGAPRPTEPSGRWLGAAAAGLGLTGAVEPTEMAAVLEGRHPTTGRAMVRRRGTVGGYDCTFTAPKSASVLWALGGPDVAAAVGAAHADAVEAAMGYVARRAVGGRRGGPATRRAVPVDGLVAAGFTHGASRAGDPHLHTHVVVANLGHGADGRWTALDGRGLYAHAEAAGALYDAHLRHGTAARLGLDWSPRRSAGYEVAGIDLELLAEFSRRRSEIRAHLAAHAGGAARPPWATPSARARHVAWAATRQAKMADGGGAAAAEWPARAAAAGWRPEDLSRALHRRAASPATLDEHAFAARVATAAGGVARRHAVAAWAGAVGAGAPVADVSACVDQLAPWGDAGGVDEARLAPAAVVPSPALLRALGGRPVAPHDLADWLGAASVVAQYRARWGVGDPAAPPLGVDGPGPAMARMAAPQLADYLRAARRVEEARRSLGRARQAGDPPELGRRR